MTKFIELHSASNESKEIWVNVANIISIEADAKGSSVELANGRIRVVIETPDEIFSKIYKMPL